MFTLFFFPQDGLDAQVSQYHYIGLISILLKDKKFVSCYDDVVNCIFLGVKEITQSRTVTVLLKSSALEPIVHCISG